MMRSVWGASLFLFSVLLLPFSCLAGLDTPGEQAAVGVFFAVLFIVLVFLRALLVRSMRVVRHAEVMIVERFGKYHTTLKPGMHFLVPFVDKPRTIRHRYVTQSFMGKLETVTVDRPTVDIREHVLDFGTQYVITKDTVPIGIDALVYFQITDPEVAVFRVQNLPDCVELLTQTTLRNIIALMTLDDTFSNRDLINSRLKEATKPDAERWGITITHVEVLNVFPPRDIQAAMEKQIQQERERRAAVLTADGDRESSIIRSQGTRVKIVLEAEAGKTAAVNKAKGKAEARILLAEAEASAIHTLRSALTTAKVGGVRATDYMLAVAYLKTLEGLGSPGAALVLIPSSTVEELQESVSKKGDEAVNAVRKTVTVS